MPYVKLIRGTSSQISSLVKEDGDILFSTDTYELFIQNKVVTYKISDIVILSLESEREELLAPLPKFYYIIESSQLYYYNVSTLSWQAIQPSLVSTVSDGLMRKEDKVKLDNIDYDIQSQVNNLKKTKFDSDNVMSIEEIDLILN